ncbi:MAG TPA: GntR family transcriptional regulator [Roseomonas sp.]|nr:GntR family transcriptional regulator [Roseomonas sp.]
MPRTPAAILHRQLARTILEHLRSSGAEPGQRLTEEALAAAMGTSRAPVRGALALLTEAGVVDRCERRLVLRRFPEDIAQAVPLDTESQDAERLYWKLAEDRLAGELPDLTGSADLMRRYKVQRPQLQRVLQQVLSEGWIERAPAGGWRFLPLIEGAEGQDEAYRFRRAIEPAALLEPRFELPRGVAERLRREQGELAGGAARRMSPRQVFETNSGFHLALMQASNNRFFADAALRVTRLRRLIGYIIATDQERLTVQSAEHLAILDSIERGNMAKASTLMLRHLDAGRASKARLVAKGGLSLRGG